MSFNLKKITGWLIIIFLFTLPWQTRWIIKAGAIGSDYWEYGTISLYASDILLLIIIILNLINWNLKKIKITKSDLILTISAIIVLTINTYLSLDSTLSLFHVGWLILALGIFIILRQEIIPRQTALLSFVSGAALSCLLGTWQFITQKTFAFSWLGLAKHASDELGTSVIEAVSPDGNIERWLRAYGSLDHPNMLGGLAVLAIFFCLYLILRENSKDKKEVFIIAAFIFLTTGLISSFSRSALIGAACSIIIYLIFAFKTNFKTTIKQAAPLFIIGLVIIILFALPYYYLLLPRLSANTRLEQISTTERIAGYKEAWPIIKNNFIIGTGFGTYGLTLQQATPKQSVWFYQPMHDVFLLLLVETGMLGSLLWLWFMLKKIIASWKKFGEERLIIAGTIITLLSLALFDHWLMSLHFGILFTAVALGLALKKA